MRGFQLFFALLGILLVSVSHAQPSVAHSLFHAVLPESLVQSLPSSQWPWVLRSHVSLDPAKPSVITSDAGLSLEKVPSSVYAVKLGDWVKLYPACWVSAKDVLRIYLNEEGIPRGFDWQSTDPQCTENDKVITLQTTTLEFVPVQTLPRPLIPLSAKKKVKPTPTAKPSTSDSNDPTAESPEGSDSNEAVEEEEIVEPQDNRSFIQKYWMYIVPILIMLLVSPGPDEPKKEGAANGPAAPEARSTGKK